MDQLQTMRRSGFGFLCCGLGLLMAAAVAGQLPWVGIVLPVIGAGMVVMARARRPG
ncbi:hypothetical protein [Luteimonas aestuarii]|uniref:hypothetical protein n=1 Tax=Luteimonas aestuarii TaxID=453837 RepID=UPI0014051BAB|nr:hypothetical protein [Luteimonas aestuarii]